MTEVVDQDSFEAKHDRALRQVRMLAYQTRVMLRTIGPRVSAAEDENFTIRNCSKCTPAPDVYTCPMCDWETDAKWRFGVHLSTRPDWCVKRGQKKARKWAANA